MNSVKEENLADKICAEYSGDLVTSKTKQVHPTSVNVTRINNLHVNVEFEIQGQSVSFKAYLIENSEGTLMMIQEKIMNFYVLNGMPGFMYEKPNVHGGFIDRLDAFYFHVQLNHFTRDYEEFYFFGRSDGLS